MMTLFIDLFMFIYASLVESLVHQCIGLDRREAQYCIYIHQIMMIMDV